MNVLLFSKAMNGGESGGGLGLGGKRLHARCRGRKEGAARHRVQ